MAEPIEGSASRRSNLTIIPSKTDALLVLLMHCFLFSRS